MQIAIVEDNEILAKGIAHRLRDQGHAVTLLHDGAQAIAYLSGEAADLIILDVNLPSRTGFEVLRSIRKAQVDTPVLMLTARSGTIDRVKGLDEGADDYLVKPFEMDELDARVRALLRRKNKLTQQTETLGKLVFNRGARTVHYDNQTITLRRLELAAFECLFDRQEQLVSKSMLADHLYGVGADIDEKTVEVHISRLRKAISHCQLEIRVARGLGYMLVQSS